MPTRIDGARSRWPTRVPAVLAVGACACFALSHALPWTLTEANVRAVDSTIRALKSAFGLGSVGAALASLLWLRPGFRPSRRVLIAFYWAWPALLVCLYLERLGVLLAG